jgi:hypothetical protein
MTCIQYRNLGLSSVALALMSCTVSTDKLSNAVSSDGGIANVVASGTASLAKQCGLDVDCKSGIADGNASISGVASVDAFFQSVLNYQTKADTVSAQIDAQLASIRGDFGVAADVDLKAELMARFAENLEGGLTVRAEPAKCALDVRAALDVQAKCDASIDPGSATMMCQGSCQADVSTAVDCGSNAELRCTIAPPMGVCSGMCTGSCKAKLDAEARCDGMCRGSCSGSCSAYTDSDATQCAGSCDGMCQGSCEAQLMTEATCSGTCDGECTITAPGAKCETAIRAHCDVKASAMVQCNTRCEGQVVPPKAMAECEASARAETKLNVECTPPRLVLDYNLKAGVEAATQTRFVAGIQNLRVRMPALLASLEQANSVAAAGLGLAADAKVAVKEGIKAAEQAVVKADLRTVVGLACAAREVDHVADAIQASDERLAKSVRTCKDVKTAIGM